MNPDITNIDTAALTDTFMGVNMSPTHLIWTTILTLVVSHLGASYLKDATPRGYWFWFTIISLILGFVFM